MEEIPEDGGAGPGIGLLRQIGRVLLASLQAWFNHRASSKGAALAFYTLFSMAPILVLAIALAGAVFGKAAAQGEIVAQLQGLVGPTGAQGIQNLLATASLPGSGGTTLAAVLLLVLGATSVFAELKDSLDELWNVQMRVPTGLLAVLRARLLSFGLVVVLAFLSLVSLLANALLAVLSGYWERLWSHSLLFFHSLSALFTFLVIAALFAVIYKMLPEVSLSWKDVAIGALCTAGLFVLGKAGIGFYLGSSSLSSSFGAAGSLVALLVWVYYSAQIFFLGAEFTREYTLAFGSMKPLPTAAPVDGA
jgi:membrane protein